MSFRKRNVVIGNPDSSQAVRQAKVLAPGTRPSPLDGRLTTSTGTSSLDQLLAGHAGLPLGTSLLVEEEGTTDFGGILLRYYAAEGLVQGHQVHVLGYGEAWRRELPGLASESKSKAAKSIAAPSSDDKMKIAWRYEALGQKHAVGRDTNFEESRQGQDPSSASAPSFCHSFDLTKRLESGGIHGELEFMPLGSPISWPAHSPLQKFLAQVSMKIQNSSPSSVHRIIVPSLLSPSLYASSACQPQDVLKFLHGLRGLLRHFSTKATAILTLPVSLYPRSSGLTRWAELVSDGVMELIPLQQQNQHQGGRDATSEGKAQGLLQIHSLPIFHEKGGGLEGSSSREDLSFRLSSSQGLLITPFSLPPVGDEDDSVKQKVQKTSEEKKESLDF